MERGESRLVGKKGKGGMKWENGIRGRGVSFEGERKV